MQACHNLDVLMYTCMWILIRIRLENCTQLFYHVSAYFDVSMRNVINIAIQC